MLTDNAALSIVLAQLAGCLPVPVQKLAQFFAAMPTKLDPLVSRALIRSHCNRDAESLAQVTASGVKSVDRSYRLFSYTACFLGSEAVQWLCVKYRLPRYEAENLLNRLLSYRLIEHVTQEHRVKDANLFFRFR